MKGKTECVFITMLFGSNFGSNVMYLRGLCCVSIMPIKSKKIVKKNKSNFLAAAKIALELEGKDKVSNAKSVPLVEKTTLSATTKEVDGKLVSKSNSKTVERSTKNLSVTTTQSSTQDEFSDLKEKGAKLVVSLKNPLIEKKSEWFEMFGGLLVIGIIVEVIVLVIIILVGMLK